MGVQVCSWNFSAIFSILLHPHLSKTTLLFSFKELRYPSSLNINTGEALVLTGLD